MQQRKDHPRERVVTGQDKGYMRRDNEGRFTESDDEGRSHAQDPKRDARHHSSKGHGDRGDRR